MNFCQVVVVYTLQDHQHNLDIQQVIHIFNLNSKINLIERKSDLIFTESGQELQF
jgi:hypothetical protein